MNLEAILSTRIVRFFFVGVLNTIFGLSLYFMFLWIGFSYPYAILISTIIGVLFNFKTIGVIVFKNKNNKLILKFFLSYAIVYLVYLGFVQLILSETNLNEYYAGIIASPFVALLSFLIQSKFVFNEKN